MALPKLPKGQYPSGHTADDFECFGPPATKDGDFSDAMIADLGCFKQDGTDTNKYYHGAVVKSKKTGDYYAYFQWGRTGSGGGDIQFYGPGSKEAAHKAFASQVSKKNDKRGEWVTIAGHEVLRAKPGKDCYLVRPAAKRVVGLPDATKIVHDDSIAKKKTTKKKTRKKKASASFDPQTIALMRDMNTGTISYAKKSIEGGHIPTQEAIDKVRDLLSEAQSRVGKIGTDDVSVQSQDRDLRELTSMVYSMVPKVKRFGAPENEWILTSGNIQQWRFDCDAFENALHAIDLGDEVETNPFEGHDIEMKYMPEDTLEGHFIKEWMPKASANRHRHVGDMRIHNMWAFRHVKNYSRFAESLKDIKAGRSPERAAFQPASRDDLSATEAKTYKSSNVAMLFHGTRSVNVPGIIREGLRLPKQLVGVVITGAMFGPGIYWADDWRKSDGYTSRPGTYYSNGDGGVKGRKAFMFIADVALGKPHLAPGPRGYTAPPSGHHSVFGKAGYSRVVNNEWIVYKAPQINLRYLVEYDTVRGSRY
tara:strand:- start:11118 stop:12719 length:1602 start_codon:yes stop_codon:yes gene_type:complete